MTRALISRYDAAAMTINDIPIPEAAELDPSIAWEVWDTAVAQLDESSGTHSPAFAAMARERAVAPWLVGARPC